MSSANQFVWLYDQRFDTLRPSFQTFLAQHGVPDAVPINGYDVFPDVVQLEDALSLPVFRQHRPEDVNRLFIDAWDRGERWGATTSPLPVASFTMDGLAERPGLALYGPSPDLVHELSNKAFQYRWFQGAGLPVPPFVVMGGLGELREQLNTLLTEHQALFVQPAYSAGGEQAAVLRSAGDFEAYSQRLATTDEECSPFIATHFFAECRTLSGHGLVTQQGRVLLLGVDELWQDRFRFDAFVFPGFEAAGVRDHILTLTRRVGELLAKKGYWGAYTADVIQPPASGSLLTEANVRIAGEGAFLAALMPYNLFLLLDGSTSPDECPLIPEPSYRVVVTKIRPEYGEDYAPEPPSGSLEEFASGQQDSFRVSFQPDRIHIVQGHFVGYAGRRFGLEVDRRTLLNYYLTAKVAEHVNHLRASRK